MKPTAERLAELSQAIRAAEQHQKTHEQTLNRYHANYLIALLLCYECELKRRKTEHELLKRAADMLQDQEEGDYNNALAMEIYAYLDSHK
jgi:hypothetical protein